MVEKKGVTKSNSKAAAKKQPTVAAKKTTAVPASKAIPVAKKASEMPQEQLKAWLKNRQSWNHQEWLELLTTLEKKGFSELVSNQQGRDAIGAFLEQNRQ